eukprot:GHVU01214938.1.p1 GENE.GHVU01214938.1~~GHVU01214938.1.p1  ORF type:complete len:182 (+),score=25.29 GHVU01214938.1:135-680(+)
MSMNKLQTAGLKWRRATLFRAVCAVAGAAVMGLAPVASGWAQTAAPAAAAPAGKPIKVALIESLSGTSADLALQRFLMGTLGATAGGSGQPAGYTVTQDDKHTTLQLDVPGLSREQLNITIEGNVVKVQSVEGAPRSVQRAWELAQDIDTAASTAKLENGVLTLTLARVEPASKATSLTIH